MRQDRAWPKGQKSRQQMRRKDDGQTGGAVMESMAEGREDEGRVFALDFIVTLGERVLGGCNWLR
jgi:hypothetical protein